VFRARGTSETSTYNLTTATFSLFRVDVESLVTHVITARDYPEVTRRCLSCRLGTMMTSRRADQHVGNRNQTRGHVTTSSCVTLSKSYRVSATGDSSASFTSQHITLYQYGGGKLTASGTVISTGSRYCTITNGYRCVELRSGTSLSSFTCLFSMLFVISLFPVTVSLKSDVIADVTGLNLQRQQAASINRVVLLNPCRAIIDDRLVNLQPLQSTDGTPRYALRRHDANFSYCFSW